MSSYPTGDSIFLIGKKLYPVGKVLHPVRKAISLPFLPGDHRGKIHT